MNDIASQAERIGNLVSLAAVLAIVAGIAFEEMHSRVVDVPGPIDFGDVRVIHPGEKGWENPGYVGYGMIIPPAPETFSRDELIAMPCNWCRKTGKSKSWLFGESLCKNCNGHTEVYYRGMGWFDK